MEQRGFVKEKGSWYNAESKLRVTDAVPSNVRACAVKGGSRWSRSTSRCRVRAPRNALPDPENSGLVQRAGRPLRWRADDTDFGLRLSFPYGAQAIYHGG